jgi:hypothetical protein
MTVYPNGPDRTLSDRHKRMLFQESGLDAGVVAERGYETVIRRSELLEFGKKQRRAGPDAPALRVPLHSPDGITRLSQIRPHTPRVPGLKYETPAGADLIIDVHPRMRDRVRHGDEPLLVTEGCKTGDAATSRDIPTVVLAGVWGWCVPGEKPYKLRPCWDHVNLEGREVNIAFDSDCMTKEGVQRALEALVRCLEERGAVVKVIYLPDAADGARQGIDDYLVAGGTIKQMFMLAREFSPADIGEIRMSRDEKLRAAIGDLWRGFHDADWMHFVGQPKPDADGEIKGHWARGHTARNVKRALIRLATRSGKLDGRGVVLRAGLRSLSEEAGVSKDSTGKAIKHLEAEGQIEVLAPEDKKKARRYRLLLSSARVGQYEGKAPREKSVKSVPPSCPTLALTPSSPNLRWPSPGSRRRREFELVPGRAVVRSTGAPARDEQEESSYVKRLGPHRGAILDTLEAAGGEMDLKDLCEALHRKRPWDVRRRILGDLEEAGIIECEGDVIRLAREWLARLDEKREVDGEIEQAEKQVEKHREQSKRYREHLDRVKRGTPQASRDAAKRTKDLRDRRLQEIAEEDERDQAPTPPEVEVLVEKILGQNERIRMGLLCEIAMEQGLRWRDVPLAVERMGYRVERLPGYGDAEFVFAERKVA